MVIYQQFNERKLQCLGKCLTYAKTEKRKTLRTSKATLSQCHAAKLMMLLGRNAGLKQETNRRVLFCFAAVGTARSMHGNDKNILRLSFDHELMFSIDYI